MDYKKNTLHSENIHYMLGYEGFLDIMKLRIREEAGNFEKIFAEMGIDIRDFAGKLGSDRQIVTEYLLRKFYEESSSENTGDREYYERKAGILKNIIYELREHKEKAVMFKESLAGEERELKSRVEKTEKYLEKILRVTFRSVLSSLQKNLLKREEDRRALQYDAAQIMKITSFHEALAEIIKIAAGFNSSILHMLPDVKREYSAEEIKMLQQAGTGRNEQTFLDRDLNIEFKITLGNCGLRKMTEKGKSIRTKCQEFLENNMVVKI